MNPNQASKASTAHASTDISLKNPFKYEKRTIKRILHPPDLSPLFSQIRSPSNNHLISSIVVHENNRSEEPMDEYIDDESKMGADEEEKDEESVYSGTYRSTVELGHSEPDIPNRLDLEHLPVDDLEHESILSSSDLDEIDLLSTNSSTAGISFKVFTKTIILGLEGNIIHYLGQHQDNSKIPDAETLNIRTTSSGYKFIVRPGIQSFLEEATQKFEIIIYTAEEEGVAKEILSVMDPNYAIIDGLLSHRHLKKKITSLGELYLIDLTYIDRNPKDVFIIHHNPLITGEYLTNMVPIHQYHYQEEEDWGEFLEVMRYLYMAEYFEDVRIINGQTFESAPEPQEFNDLPLIPLRHII